MISSLLSVPFQLFKEGFYVDLNWLGSFVKVIVEGVGIVGLGVIVFTLILKAITTPFDIYQRVKMRKQNLVMKQMQPELEKLQKQYANDKQTYNLKMMELQKKNGVSMFGACLPMIVTFVILIFAVTGFQSYARYANLAIYEKMARSYNEALSDYVVDLGGEPSSYTAEDGSVQWIIRSEDPDDQKYIYVTYEGEKDAENRVYAYYIDDGKLYAAEKSAIDAIMAEENISQGEACTRYFEKIGAKAAAERYREIAGSGSDDPSNPHFLWIKNVWSPDVSFRHPVQSYQDFCGTVSGSDIVIQSGEKIKITALMDEDAYNALTEDLAEEKQQANGYYILIILTLALMVLSQFFTMRSQKESNKFQTVDGQGAKTQKIMMVVIPLIYAVTGFLWTAAFSIYIAVSSIFGIVLTLLSNLIIGRIFKKKEEEAIKARYTRTVPWKQDKRK